MNSSNRFSVLVFFVLTVAIFIPKVSAQTSNWISTWQPGGTFVFHSSVTDAQGNIYVAYSSYNESTQTNRLGIVKHSSQGALVWDVTVENGGYSDKTQLFYSEADKLYAWVKDNIYIYSPEGEFISSFSASYDNHNKIFVNADEEVLITYFGVEHEGSAQGFGAAKYNAAGLLVWDDVYRDVVPNIGYLVDTEIDSEGFIYLLGMDGNNAVIIKAASNGLEQWEKQISYIKANDLELGHDNSIYIGGRASTNTMGLTKFGNDGTFNWSKAYSAPDGNGQYMKLLKSNPGIFAGGYHGVPSVGNVLLAHHFSENGDLLFEYEQQDPTVVPQISFAEADYGFQIINNGNIFISCMYTTNFDFFYGLVRLNSSGGLAGNSYIEGTNYGFSCLTFDSYLYGGSITQLCVEPLSNSGTEYQLKIINYPTSITSVEDESETPINFSLSQNYPNPFNPSTKINYSLSERSYVSLKVINMLGETVANVVNMMQNSGKYEVEFDAFGLTSGTYFIVLNSGLLKEVKKMILLK